jgi:hypothetical protein
MGGTAINCLIAKKLFAIKERKKRGRAVPLGGQNFRFMVGLFVLIQDVDGAC